MTAEIFSDYQVSFRSREDIAGVAVRWRQEGRINSRAYFNVVTFVENILRVRFTHKGKLKIEFFEARPEGRPAFVTYNPLTLHIDSERWQLAKMGDPESRHIIAHEIGHIILHDHNAKAFSNDSSDKKFFAPMDEYRAEWQADIFAAYFLAPDHIVNAFGCSKLVAENCSIPQKLAEQRCVRVEEEKRRGRRYSGEVCPNCNNLTIIREGLLQRCDTCRVEFMD